MVLNPLFDGLRFSFISAGSYSIATCSADQIYYGWGQNDVGQIGGSLSPTQTAPINHTVGGECFYTIRCLRTLALRYSTYVVDSGGSISASVSFTENLGTTYR